MKRGTGEEKGGKGGFAPDKRLQSLQDLLALSDGAFQLSDVLCYHHSARLPLETLQLSLVGLSVELAIKLKFAVSENRWWRAKLLVSQ